MQESKTTTALTMGSKRSVSLDALRGFAILTMVLSGVIPYGVLPAWMYHAQLPPPDHVFNPDLPGMTWVDLVFPMFLFAMGTAIPLAVGKRLRAGDSYPKLILYILERTALLLFFAIFLRHVRPHVLNPDPGRQEWLLALAGFAAMFAIFLRFPAGWSKRITIPVRYGGWILAVALLYFLEYPDGSGFSLYRSNIIILVLANVYLFGSLIWLVTRENMLLRLGLLVLLFGLRLAHHEPGWVEWLWNATPFPWFYKLDYLKYLFIVVPGTIAGDLFQRWHRKRPEDTHAEVGWSKTVPGLIFVLIVGLILILFVGLQARWMLTTTLFVFAGCLILYLLTRNPENGFEDLVRQLVTWSIYWMVLGLVFEPFEGGIKKDHSTMSYYFITTAISIWILVLFSIIGDCWKRPGWLKLLSENGKNPMLAYVGVANFIWPVFGLLGIDHLIQMLTPGPWPGFLRGLLYTLLLAWMVMWFSRKKLFWRT